METTPHGSGSVMKRNLLKIAFISVALPSLFSCVNNSVDDGSATSSDFSYSFGYPETVDGQTLEIEEFISQLEAIEGSPKKLSVVQKEQYAFYTGGDSLFTIESTDTFTVERFHRNNASDILIRKGAFSMEGYDDATYECQIFNDATTFYQLTKYDENTKTKSTGAYDPSTAESTYTISLTHSETSNLRYLESYLGVSGFGPAYNFENAKRNGTFSYEYGITQYDDDGSEAAGIHHELSVTASNSAIVSYTHEYLNVIFLNGEASQYQYTKTEATVIESGDYDVYSGEVFNPDDFSSSSN